VKVLSSGKEQADLESILENGVVTLKDTLQKQLTVLFTTKDNVVQVSSLSIKVENTVSVTFRAILPNDSQLPKPTGILVN